MAYRRKIYKFFPFLFLLIILGLSSCEKFEGDQTIPAFLKIDSISLSTDYTTQGTASHAITDAWVYIDDDYLGTYELPARVPVLKQGQHKITILPGIKKDGIAATRWNYPFYKQIIKNVKFGTDSTTKLGTLSTSYEENAKFLFREDFEQVNMQLDTTVRSDVAITKTEAGSPYTFDLEGNHSGMVVMDSSYQFFECMSHDPISIPASPVYLEMNFNTNNELSVGVYIYVSYYVYQVNIITLNPTNGAWKKIYIDMTNMLNAYSGAEKFRLSIGTFKTTQESQARIIIDNLKILTISSQK